MKIAWIGTGVMGKSMLLHLVHGGHSVSAYNRTKAKALDLAKDGVKVCDSIEECVSDAELVCTMVGYPKDVVEVYQKIFSAVQAGTILIDFTTSSPKLAQQLYKEAKNHGLDILDAPVSGGDSGAKAATLSIMVGGDKKIFETVTPVLSLLGNSLHYMGEAGSGQHAKACNQIAVAGAVAAMSEAIVYAEQNHLNVETMLEAIKGGAAGSWQIANTAPRVLRKDFAPGFYIHHFIKDMHIVQEEMAGKVNLPMLNTVCEMYEELAKTEGNNGTQALVHYYRTEK